MSLLTSYICTLPDFYITNLGVLIAVNGYLFLSLLLSVLFADNTTCLSKGKKLNDLIGFVKSELQKRDLVHSK
jgi:hypothetical protein